MEQYPQDLRENGIGIGEAAVAVGVAYWLLVGWGGYALGKRICKKKAL